MSVFAIHLAALNSGRSEEVGMEDAALRVYTHRSYLQRGRWERTWTPVDDGAREAPPRRR